MVDESTPNPTFGEAFEFFRNCPGVLPEYVVPYAWATARRGQFSINLDKELDEYRELLNSRAFEVAHG